MSDASALAHDYYPTPAWCVTALLDHPDCPEPLQSPAIVDPFAGDGAILRAHADWHGRGRWSLGIDIDPRHASTLREETFGSGVAHDSIAMPIALDGRACLTNPPYNRLGDAIYPYVIQPGACVAALLRLSALRPLWRKTPKVYRTGRVLPADDRRWIADYPPALFVLRERPSFTGDGATDSSDYAWFVWQDGLRGGVFFCR